MTINVLGTGSWGTAMAVLLDRNGHSVQLAGRDEEEIGILRSHRENVRYLPGFAVPASIKPCFIAEAAADADVWVIAVPSVAVHDVVQHLPESPRVVIASKGLGPNGARLSQIILDARPNAAVAALSGPNLAVEIMRGIPTAAVVGSLDSALAEQVATAFNCRTFRAYISDDIAGIELAGALKNVLAIAGGISDGLGFGNNTKGALMARGLLEMTRLGISLGANPSTFFGIAGVGDLFATAASTLSRNYRVGFALGQGRRLPEILEEIDQVAEGVPTAEAASVLARRSGCPSPILEMTDSVLRGRLSPKDGVTMLMDRQPKDEGWAGLVSS